MVSFRHKFVAGLKSRNIETCDDLADTPYQTVLVIGGTRDLASLWRVKKRGIQVIQRLDGMNWLHRLSGKTRSKNPRWSRIHHFLRAEYGNLVLRTIRSQLANRLIYQSTFVQDWWERKYGITQNTSTVIHNGVDLNLYTPDGPGVLPQDRWRILMVEGSLMGGYEQGLEVAVRLAQKLVDHLYGGMRRSFPTTQSRISSHKQNSVQKVELMVVGRVAETLQEDWDSRLVSDGYSSKLSLTWVGQVPGEMVPELDRSAHLLYSADINAACPNSVIEALACGLPVISFDTGALSELVIGDAGRIVPYGGDSWRLDPPDVDALAQAGLEIISDQDRFRKEARTCAESNFSLDHMVESYLEVLLDH